MKKGSYIVAVSPEDENDPDIKAFVEADFIAEYQLTAELEQEAIDAFALKNASYHVWPYWRAGLRCKIDIKFPISE